MPYMGAALTALAMGWSTQATAQDQFKDLDPKHWAYEAVTDLQSKGILIGYPDGYFKGKRALTRYEFAIALKRALDKIQATPGPKGDKGDKGDTGDAGPIGPPGMTPEEVANLRRLTDEFRNELASLGANIRDINNRLDALARDIAEINRRLDRMVHWSGSVFVGAQTTRSRSAFIDYSGAYRANPTTAQGGTNTIFGPANVVHSADLRASANLGGGGQAVVDLNATNYLAYRGSSLTEGAFASPTITGVNIAGVPQSSSESVTPLEAYYKTPIGGEHSGTEFTIGRFKDQGTALTYSRPSLDAYFNVPGYDDGKYIEDGAKLEAKLGSAKLKLTLGSYASVTDNLGNSFNQPLIGGGFIGAGGHTLSGIPFGIDPLGDQILAAQTASVDVGLPLFGAGQLGLGARMFSSNLPAGASLDPAATYTDEVVYDVNLKLNPLGRILFYAEAAKSVSCNGINGSDPSSDNSDNNAYTVSFGYGSGPIDVRLGYNYIDPNYGAPGDWMKLGNWWNPTDLEGGFLNIKYKLSDKVGFHIGGDLLEGARNRPGYIVIGDRVNRAQAGLGFKLSNALTLTADYEGVFFDIAGGNPDGSTAKPNEQFVTIGLDAKLSGNTFLNVGYQFMAYNSASAFPLAFNGAPGFVGYDPSTGAVGSASNAGVLTTQLSVHF